MLRRFNVKNFMSFLSNKEGNSDEFSMLPGKVRNMKSHLCDDGDKGLLKFAAIYGANASGKSNLIKAIKCMKNILMKNSAEGYTDKYCRIGGDNKSKPTYFEVEFSLNKNNYCYGFEIILSQSRFVSEWLVELRENGNETVIFERDIENSEFELCDEWQNDKELINRLEIYMEDVDTEKTSLFLSYMNDRKEMFYEKYPKVKILEDVYEWFSETLNINGPNSLLSIESSGEKIEKALQFIASFGTGINDYNVESVELDYIRKKASHRQEVKTTVDLSIDYLNGNIRLREKIKKHKSEYAERERDTKIVMLDQDIEKRMKIYYVFPILNEMFFIKAEEDEVKGYVLKFKHSDENSFDFGEESDGTQRLWQLLEVLLTDEERIFVIDEIDRCMHPSLTYKFVKNFFELSENKNVQLIVTTHESRLLDFDLLRRDEIWFVKKQKNGDSEIYSLEDYNERFDRKIDKAYLEGRYGGVPVFTSLFPIEEGE